MRRVSRRCLPAHGMDAGPFVNSRADTMAICRQRERTVDGGDKRAGGFGDGEASADATGGAGRIEPACRQAGVAANGVGNFRDCRGLLPGRRRPQRVAGRPGILARHWRRSVDGVGRVCPNYGLTRCGSQDAYNRGGRSDYLAFGFRPAANTSFTFRTDVPSSISPSSSAVQVLPRRTSIR